MKASGVNRYGEVLLFLTIFLTSCLPDKKTPKPSPSPSPNQTVSPSPVPSYVQTTANGNITRIETYPGGPNVSTECGTTTEETKRVLDVRGDGRNCRVVSGPLWSGLAPGRWKVKFTIKLTHWYNKYDSTLVDLSNAFSKADVFSGVGAQFQDSLLHVSRELKGSDFSTSFPNGTIAFSGAAPTPQSVDIELPFTVFPADVARRFEFRVFSYGEYGRFIIEKIDAALDTPFAQTTTIFDSRSATSPPKLNYFLGAGVQEGKWRANRNFRRPMLRFAAQGVQYGNIRFRFELALVPEGDSNQQAVATAIRGDSSVGLFCFSGYVKSPSSGQIVALVDPSLPTDPNVPNPVQPYCRSIQTLANPDNFLSSPRTTIEFTFLNPANQDLDIYIEGHQGLWGYVYGPGSLYNLSVNPNVSSTVYAQDFTYYVDGTGVQANASGPVLFYKLLNTNQAAPIQYGPNQNNFTASQLGNYQAIIHFIAKDFTSALYPAFDKILSTFGTLGVNINSLQVLKFDVFDNQPNIANPTLASVTITRNDLIDAAAKATKQITGNFGEVMEIRLPFIANTINHNLEYRVFKIPTYGYGLDTYLLATEIQKLN